MNFFKRRAFIKFINNVNNGKLSEVKEYLNKDNSLVNDLYRSSNALNIATRNKNHQMIKLLLDNKANPNLGNPILNALGNNDLESVKMLIDYGAKQNDTALLPYAIFRNCSLNIINLLVDKGADINEGDSYGYTPLIIAATKGYFEVVEYLLAKGANINQTECNYGRNALLWTLLNGHYEIAKKLIKANADLTIRDKQRRAIGEYPYIITPEIKKLILEKQSFESKISLKSISPDYNNLVNSLANQSIIEACIKIDQVADNVDKIDDLIIFTNLLGSFSKLMTKLETKEESIHREIFKKCAESSSEAKIILSSLSKQPTIQFSAAIESKEDLKPKSPATQNKLR